MTTPQENQSPSPSIRAESEAVQSGCSSPPAPTDAGSPSGSPNNFSAEMASPSRVLGGSTSWTAGLAPGCMAAIKRNSNNPTSSTTHSTLSPGLVTVRGGATLDSLKNWTIATYKCGRQSLLERLGRSTRTVDAELEAQIVELRATQRKFAEIVRLSRAFCSHLQHLSATQASLAEIMADLGNKEAELRLSFEANSEGQRNLARSGEHLALLLNDFVSSINTLCHKTMDDTLVTVRSFEMARVEFDAYREDLERLATSNDANESRRREAERSFQKQRDEFEQLRSDVQIKMRFLGDNKIKVMRQQLELFLSAITAYYSNNGELLEKLLTRMREEVRIKGQSESSWIEK